MKKALALTLALLTLLSLAACGAKSEAVADDNLFYRYDAPAAEAAPMETPMAGGWYDGAVMEEAVEMETTEAEPMEPNPAPAGGNAPEAQTMAEKIIYSASLSMESTEFDRTMAVINELITRYGGYIQSSTVNGDTVYNEDGTTTVINRMAWYSISVPTEHFETFLTESGNAGNVTSTHRNAENITSAYTDTEARLESLHVQEERLMAMMEETGDLESLIALEARLAEVTYEIESYQRQINNWDRRIAYSTIDIDLREVSIYTPTAPVTRTFGEKLSDAFADGWRYFGRRVQRFVLWFAESLPSLILWAIIITGGIFGFRKIRKVRKTRKAAKKPQTDASNTPNDGFPR